MSKPPRISDTMYYWLNAVAHRTSWITPRQAAALGRRGLIAEVASSARVPMYRITAAGREVHRTRERSK